MAILKKIKGATLMETLVATVLIVIIFMVASLIMNSLMAAQSKGDVQAITEYIKSLEYNYLNSELRAPYAETWENWEITMVKDKKQGVEIIEVKAIQELSNKQVVTYLVAKE
jgi:Tfp pilus assembly protein PilV